LQKIFTITADLSTVVTINEQEFINNSYDPNGNSIQFIGAYGPTGGTVDISLDRTEIYYTPTEIGANNFYYVVFTTYGVAVAVCTLQNK